MPPKPRSLRYPDACQLMNNSVEISRHNKEIQFSTIFGNSGGGCRCSLTFVPVSQGMPVSQCAVQVLKGPSTNERIEACKKKINERAKKRVTRTEVVFTRYHEQKSIFEGVRVMARTCRHRWSSTSGQRCRCVAEIAIWNAFSRTQRQSGSSIGATVCQNGRASEVFSDGAINQAEAKNQLGGRWQCKSRADVARS